MNIRTATYVIQDTEQRLAQITIWHASSVGSLPRQVLLCAHAAFAVSTGECLKWQGESAPSLAAFLITHQMTLEQIPQAKALTTASPSNMVYAYAHAGSGFYCGLHQDEIA